MPSCARRGALMACIFTAAECFAKRVVTSLPVTERGHGWYSMRCPVGRHGKPLRFHVGDHVHISYADLGGCPESDIFAWLVKQGIPRECLRRPKDWPAVKRSPEFGTEDGKLADAILDAALNSEVSVAQRLVQVTLLALDGELPEGPMCDVIADRLGLAPRTVYKATEEQRRKGRGW